MNDNPEKMDISLPDVPEEEVIQQWNKICTTLQKEIQDDENLAEKRRNTLLHYKIFDKNLKKLSEKGFRTSNHVVSCPIRHRHLYVTVVSWA